MAEQSWASTPAVRSSMQSNKSRDTKPELAVRRALHALGLRYRVCERPLPAVRRTVDVVFRRARVAVEIRGCFWHGCAEHYRGPSANGSYWADKVARNIARDADTERRLAEAGWTLLVVWEHEDPRAAALRVREVLSAARGDADSARAGSARAGSARAGSARAGSVEGAGSARTGSDPAALTAPGRLPPGRVRTSGEPRRAGQAAARP